MLNFSERTLFTWVTTQQTPVPRSQQHNCCLFPGTWAIVDVLSSTRNSDKPPPNQTTELTEEHRGNSQNPLSSPLWTLCTLWFNPSLGQYSTSNGTRQPVRLFALTGLRASAVPSAKDLSRIKFRISNVESSGMTLAGSGV